MSKEDFERFLTYARMVADFDGDRKVWVLSPRKLLAVGRREAESILYALKSLSTLTDEQIREVLSKLDEVSEKAQEIVYVTGSLGLRGPERILRKLTIEPSISGFLIKKNSGLYLSSLIKLPVLLSILEKTYGVKVVFDRSMLIARVTRENSYLKIAFKRMDRELARELLSEGLLTYNIEKAVLGPNGEYQGSELVQRTLRVSRVSWEEKAVMAPVALIDKYLSKLSSLGFEAEVHIEERKNISVNLTKTFELLPHQEEAFNLWFKRKRGTIAIFTRGGKSFIALEAIYRLKKPSLILVTTQELVNTWLNYLGRYLSLPHHFIGVLGAGEQKIRDITVATYASAVKYIEDIKSMFELVIFDEAHHVPAQTFKNVALKLDALYRLALSATPTRRDNNHELLYELCGPLLYTLSYEDLVKLKIVAPIEKFQTLFVEGEEEKLRKLLDVLKENPGAKTIVFTQYVDSAERVHNFLRERGFKAVLVTGQTPSAKREIMFKDFLEGRADIIVSTTVLDEGITVPDAEVAVIYEGSGEGRQMIQRIGRVLGYAPNKTAKIYEIVNVTNPREKYAHIRRSWVRELYMFRGLEKYVEAVKSGTIDDVKSSYQRRLDSY